MDLIFVDFNNADKKGRLRLNLSGTIRDLENKNIKLVNGLKLQFGDGCELYTEGIVEYSDTESIWVAIIDWDNIQNTEI